MNKIKVVIVDDEIDARATLINFLNKKCPTVEVVGQGDSVKTGIDTIQRVRPDLVFLDIKMGDGTGFEVLNQIDLMDLAVVFTTAYDDYAIKAIRNGALDYLLKPIDPLELIDAVKKVEKQREQVSVKPVVPAVKSGVRIPIIQGHNMSIVYSSEILFVESEGGLSYIHLNTGERKVSSNSIGKLEDILGSKDFFRIHQSYLINCDCIESFNRKENIVKIGQNQLEVSRRKKSDFIKFLFDTSA